MQVREATTLDEQINGNGHAGPQTVKPIAIESPAAPRLPDDIVDGWFGDMVYAVAEATETRPELALCFGLAVLGTACQKRFSVCVKPGYFEPTNIWLLAAMDSGNRKTGAMTRMISPLFEWERRKASELMPLIEKVQSERKTIDERVKRLRAVAAKATNEDFASAMAEVAALESAMPPLPTIPQLYSQDVTPEHAGTMLAEHGEKLALLSDEGGLFDIMAGRYSAGIPNVDVFLQSHAGSPVRVNRGSRPPVNLQHPAMTIGISPQPDVLRSLAANRDFRGRGLLARFLYMVPDSSVGYRKNQGPDVPEHVSEDYAESVSTLLDIEPATGIDGRPTPHTLTLAHGAYEAWDQFWHRTEMAMRPGGKLEHLRDWGGKLPGAVARIAGLLHCATFASCVTDHLQIQPDSMARAIRLGTILVQHATVAFDLMGGDPAMSIARDLWSKIQAARQPRISKFEAWRPLRNKYKAKDVDPAFDLLVQHGYLAEPQTSDNGHRGRGRPPGRTFIVNPDIAAQWQ